MTDDSIPHPTASEGPVTAGAHAAFRAQRFFGSLDGLRALSVLAVIWHHSDVQLAWLPATRRGFLGVDMFFVISGFLIVTLLLRERTRSGAISLRGFYARRTLRIFPAYYGVLLALALLYLFRDSPRATQFWSELPLYLAYASNWVPVLVYPIAWSLAAEEQFYLCWPPIEKWLRRLAVPLMLVFVAANQMVNFGVGIGAPGTWLGDRYPTLAILQATFTPICLGVLLAHLLHGERGFRAVGRALAPPAAAIAFAAALVVVCNLPTENIRGLHRLAIQALMTGVVGACVVSETNGLAGLLRLAPIARIGVVSYGMYLFHVFVIGVVHAAPAEIPRLAAFACSVAGTWVVAEASYRLYETRFLAWKRRIGKAQGRSVVV
jgi:peptidoglycan/LPS O-acetylase OafA/YrhL